MRGISNNDGKDLRISEYSHINYTDILVLTKTSLDKILGIIHRK